MSDLTTFLLLVAGGLVGSLLGTYLASKKGAALAELKIESVHRLSLSPGDKVVVRLTSGHLSCDQVERIKDQLDETFAGYTVVLLGPGIEVSSVVGEEPSAGPPVKPKHSITIPFPDRRVGA